MSTHGEKELGLHCSLLSTEPSPAQCLAHRELSKYLWNKCLMAYGINLLLLIIATNYRILPLGQALC